MHRLITSAARAVCLALIATTALAQIKPEISADDARRDLRILQQALVALHPGLYRYATPAQIDAEFAAAQQAVAQGTDRAQMVLLASRLAASVHCGHTWASRYNQADVVVKTVFERTDKLPLTLRWAEGRALITGSTAANVTKGSELLAIDGRPVAQIANALLPYIRADAVGASADGKRWSQLDSGPNGGAMDRLFPLLFAPAGGGYTLHVRDNAQAAARDVQVAAVKLADRERLLPDQSSAWLFRIDGDTAVLTLPTFAFWRSDFKPNEFITRTFETLRATPAVRFLIIDQRRNEGGDDGIGRTLLSHLLKAPFSQPGSRTESAYERVPYALARYLDTWDFSFFDRTGQVTKGSGRNWLMSEVVGRRIDPVATPFAGRTVLLVGPQNSSAGYLLARDVKASGAATLVGQLTGGNQRGLNGGQLAWINLPASGVGVDIPLIAGVTTGDVPDGGVAPDLHVPPRFADLQAGVDAEMAQALTLIAGWRTTP
jgi:Peptidase family S41